MPTRADKRFDALLLASASIVWWTNAAGEFVEEQPSWREYTGQSWEEYRGSAWVSCLHPDDRASIIADSPQLMSAVGRACREYGGPRRPGRVAARTVVQGTPHLRLGEFSL
jgi:hypothetical protein